MAEQQPRDQDPASETSRASGAAGSAHDTPGRPATGAGPESEQDSWTESERAARDLFAAAKRFAKTTATAALEEGARVADKANRDFDKTRKDLEALGESTRDLADKLSESTAQTGAKVAERVGMDFEQTRKDLEALGASTQVVAEQVAQRAAETTKKVLEGAGERLRDLSERLGTKRDADR
jgi:gas vesicle protein